MGRFCIERRGKKKRRKGQRGKGAKNPNTTHTTPKKMASSDEDSDIETGLSRYDDNSDEELNQEELLEMDAVFGLRDRQDMVCFLFFCFVLFVFHSFSLLSFSPPFG